MRIEEFFGRVRLWGVPTQLKGAAWTSVRAAFAMGVAACKSSVSLKLLASKADVPAPGQAALNLLRRRSVGSGQGELDRLFALFDHDRAQTDPSHPPAVILLPKAEP